MLKLMGKVWGEIGYLHNLEVSSPRYLLITKGKINIYSWELAGTTVTKGARLTSSGMKYSSI